MQPLPPKTTHVKLIEKKYNLFPVKRRVSSSLSRNETKLLLGSIGFL